jgi:hypothetical protein
MRKAVEVGVVVAAFAAVAIGLPREAHAIGPVEVEGGGFVGYGTNPSHGPSPFMVELGARLGASFQGVYAGLAINYYFGDSGTCGGGAPGSGPGVTTLPASFCSSGSGEVSVGQKALLLGIDLGYTFKIPRASWLRLRPMVEIGNANISRNGTLAAQDFVTGPLATYGGGNYFYVQPGLLAMAVIDTFFVGISANLLVVPSVLDIEGTSANADGTLNLLTSTRTLASFNTNLQTGFRF